MNRGYLCGAVTDNEPCRSCGEVICDERDRATDLDPFHFPEDHLGEAHEEAA